MDNTRALRSSLTLGHLELVVLYGVTKQPHIRAYEAIVYYCVQNNSILGRYEAVVTVGSYKAVVYNTNKNLIPNVF